MHRPPHPHAPNPPLQLLVYSLCTPACAPHGPLPTPPAAHVCVVPYPPLPLQLHMCAWSLSPAPPSAAHVCMVPYPPPPLALQVLVCGWGDQDFMKQLISALDSGPAALGYLPDPALPPGSTVTFFNDHDVRGGGAWVTFLI